MMIWILIYLAIGAAFSVYLQSARVATLEKSRDIPLDAWAAMTDGERAFLQSTLTRMRDPYPTWMLIGAGFLWPTQIVAWCYAEVASRRIRRQREAAHVHTTVCRCPGCHQNLVTKPGVDCIESDPKGDTPDLVAFVCPCGVASEWDFGPPVPILIRIRTAAPLGVGSEEAP